MNRQKWLQLAGYNTFFWLCFWLFAYWSFPYQRLAAFITDKVNESGSGYTLEIGGLSPYWVSGVELEQVQIRKTAAEALAVPEGEKPKPAQAIQIETAQARIGIFGLLFGTRSVSFSAELGSGTVEGNFREQGEDKKVVAELEGVDLAKFALLESLVALPMKGVLKGDFDLTLGKVPTKTQGSVKLGIDKLVIGDGKAKLKLGAMGGLTIDPIDAGAVVVDIDVKDGVGTVRKLTAAGSDLKLNGSGDVRFAQPLARSRLNMMLKLNLTDSYRNKSNRTKAMFMMLDSGGAPQVAAAKTNDGGFQFRLSGPFTSVRALPAGQAPLAAPGAPAAPALGPQPGDEEE
ncbi:MAG TPA: type II secretion system protein GspN [Polyangiales bacterium]|nr:type II secretion system protein GspN [Polyangiales bacterium]